MSTPLYPKGYLGDGVYVSHDGYGLVLTTEDGLQETNRIVLELEVYKALLAYVETLLAGPRQSSQPRTAA